MSSTFFGLETAKRGILAQQFAEDTVSHNIVNANTPGYTRQTVALVTTDPFPEPSYNRESMVGQIGTGVQASAVTDARDNMLESRIKESNWNQSGSTTLSTQLSQLESIFNEPSGPSIGDSINNYWNALNDVSNNPDSGASRANLINVTDSLTADFKNLNTNLDTMSSEIDQTLTTNVQSINNISSQINNVNMEIFKAQTLGLTPNDLMDQRNTLLNQLSQYTNFQTTTMPSGMVKVEISGHTLVGENYVVKMNAVTDAANKNHIKAVFADNGADAVITGGSMKALTDVRDTYITSYKASVDQMAQSLISGMNSLQSAGYAINGAAPTGIDFFSGTGMADIDLNPAIRADATLIAASSTANSTGDGSNALKMADLKDASIMDGGTLTINEHYSNLISKIGSDSNSASSDSKIYSALAANLTTQRQSQSGVSLDEEMTDLIKYQHAFEANTKVMKVQDELLQTIIAMIP
jgi:flagellar hook-associated protein 1